MNTKRIFPIVPLALLLACPACGNLSDVPILAEHVAYTPEGKLVVFTTAATKVYEGDLTMETASIPAAPDVETWGVASANLSADGLLAAVSYGGRARIYGIPGGQAVGAIDVAEDSNSTQFSVLSPQGDFLFLWGGSTQGPDGQDVRFPGRSYQTSDGTPLWEVHPDFPLGSDYCSVWNDDNPPVFAADGETLYVPLTDRVIAVDAKTGTAQIVLHAKACVNGLVVLPDGSLLVHRGWGRASELRLENTPPSDAAQDESFAIYSPEGTLLRELPAFAGYVTPGTWGAAQTPLACAPDGNTCVMYAEQGALDMEHYLQRHGAFLLVFRLDGTLLFPIELDRVARNVTISPDGTRIAVATGGARVYSLTDGTLLGQRDYAKGVF